MENKMDNAEIKRTNRKAMPLFILVLICSLLIGGAGGFFAAKYGLNMLEGSLKSCGAFFGANIAPWLLLAAAVIVPAVSIPIYRRTKNLLSSWDGENEEVSDVIERKLSVVIWFTGAALIVSFFFIAASYSDGFEIFEDRNRIVPFFASIAGFIAVMIEAMVIQQKCVDTFKRMNPEKKASVYDPKFQKKWLDSCDEAEKIVIGKCAHKAFSATNSVCSALAGILALCALIFGTGLLPSLAVCIVWFVNQSIYCKEAIKYSRAGSKIS